MRKLREDEHAGRCKLCRQLGNSEPKLRPFSEGQDSPGAGSVERHGFALLRPLRSHPAISSRLNLA